MKKLANLKKRMSQKKTSPKKEAKQDNKINFSNRKEALEWLSDKPFQPNVRLLEVVDGENNKKKIPALGIDLTFVIYSKDITKITERVKQLWDKLVEIDQDFLKEMDIKAILGDDFC